MYRKLDYKLPNYRFDDSSRIDVLFGREGIFLDHSYYNTRSVVGYSRINSTKCPASGAGTVNKPKLMSQ